MNLFDQAKQDKQFRAVWVQYGNTHPVTEQQRRELSTKEWSNYAKGGNVDLQTIKGKFLSYNAVTNTVYLEEL